MTRRALLVVSALLTLSACAPTEDALTRLVIHRGGRVSGPMAQSLARHPQIIETQSPWWVGEGAPPSDFEWTLVGQRDRGSLWRRRELVVAADVAVMDETFPGSALSHDVFRAWSVDGPVSPGGELAVRVFLQPPSAMPLRSCVRLLIGDLTLPLGTLIDGLDGLYPGVDRRPSVRHRALVTVPQTVQVGAN
ncbi:MAG: hypothetical protein ACI9MC_001869, partial [Kiritimatiellia bacterium]